MKIGIDARILVTQRGMGRVLRFVVRPLMDLAKDDEVYFYTGPGETPILSSQPNLRVRALKTDFIPLYEQMHLPKAVDGDRLDVFWSPANTGPIRVNAPHVLTLHDVIFRHRGTLLPHSSSMYQRFGAQYTDWCASKLARSAAHVITDSEFSAKEIRELLGAPSQNVTSIPLGVTLEADGSDFGPEDLKAFGIDRPFFLFLGATDPRKNTDWTIDAFLDSKVADDTQLVIAGLKPAEVETHRQRIASRTKASTVVFLDFISDEALAGLYRNCLALVFSSLYEGFGLPVLEAMHFGTPVLASNQSSIPEVGGDAVVYFDPRSAEQLSSELKRMLDHEGLRQELSRAGKVQSQKFSWQKSAEAVYDILRRAAK